MIFGPDGKALCEAVGAGEEVILKADIDLRDIDYAKTVGDILANENTVNKPNFANSSVVH